METLQLILSLVCLGLYFSILSDLKYFHKKHKASEEREKDKPKIIG